MKDEEGIDSVKERKHKNRKIVAILIVIIIIQVGFIAVWSIYLRPWTIRDVARAANIDFTTDGGGLMGEMREGQRNPGFSHDLAGMDKTVKGRITNITTYSTTLGPLTYIELDNFEDIRLIEWDLPSYKIGDEIEKKVHFKWSHWNEDRNVYSPQLDFPALGAAPVIELIINGVSCIQGLILLANQTDPGGLINVSVVLPMGEGFPLELFDCSLRKGTQSWFADYSDASGGFWENPMIDSISPLSNSTGQNNIVRFSDANHNELLDDGDYFMFDIPEPEEDGAILTYQLSINMEPGYFNRVLSGLCYLVMTNRGLLRYTSCVTEMADIPPYLTLKILNEQETIDGISTRINITHVLGEVPSITSCECSLYGIDDPYFGIQSIPLVNGEVYNGSDIIIELLDNNDNGLLDRGDHFIIFGLENQSYYRIYIEIEAWYEDIRTPVKISNLNWLTGIGAFTGNLPVIDCEEPFVLGSPENKTFKIEIARMYGVPGLNLTDENPNRWFRVKIELDGLEILTPMNLILDFEENSGDINLTFEDVDDNGFINTGDNFVYTGDSPGEYILTLDYVRHDNRYEDGIRVLFSQSVSWTIS